MLLALLVMLSVVLPAGSVGAAPTPDATRDEDGSLAAMLGRLPDLPLGTDEALGISGASVRYADVALQAAAMGFAPPQGNDDVAAQEGWITAVAGLYLPDLAIHWLRPEWRQSFGFDLFQVEQAAEYHTSWGRIAVLRGTFDAGEVRAALTRRGYQPLDLGAGEAYVVADEADTTWDDDGERMARWNMNVVAIADDGSLVYSAVREGVALTLAAAAGQAPSFAERAEIAPLLQAAPADLATAVLVPGAWLQAPSAVEAAMLEGESPEALATRVAAEYAEAQRLPQVVVALLGQTAGTGPAVGEAMPATPTTSPAAPLDRLVVILITHGQGSVAQAASVITERLSTQRVPAELGGDLAGRLWADLFPQRIVQAVSEQAVLIELVPVPDVGLSFLSRMVDWRVPGFLAWAP